MGYETHFGLAGYFLIIAIKSYFLTILQKMPAKL